MARSSSGEMKKVHGIQETIDEQVVRMDQIVGYQLERAVADSPVLIRKSIFVPPVATKLINALQKVYHEKNINIELNMTDCTFFGDERDLLEMLGNIVDNACKYGNHQVSVNIAKQSSVDLMLIVEDDGAGILMRDRDKILNRGLRLDSKESGQGIGLAVVVEIVERYGGEINVGESALGGAKITVAL